MYLSFTVRNVSDNNLQSLQGGDYRNRFGRPESYSVTVVDQHGKALPVLDARSEAGYEMAGGLCGELSHRAWRTRRLLLGQIPALEP